MGKLSRRWKRRYLSLGFQISDTFAFRESGLGIARFPRVPRVSRRELCYLREHNMYHVIAYTGCSAVKKPLRELFFSCSLCVGIAFVSLCDASSFCFCCCGEVREIGWGRGGRGRLVSLFFLHFPFRFRPSSCRVVLDVATSLYWVL